MLAALLALILSIPSTHFETGYATTFGHTPEDLGGTPACYYRLPRREYLRKLPRGCAHRTIPCGAELEVWRLHRGRLLRTTCYVVDRGPNGRRKDGRYRGIVDLLPGPAREVRIGRAPVLLVWRKK